MAAFPVVEEFDVVEQVCRSFRPRGVAGSMHPLVLQAVKDTLSRRVIPAVPLATHGADHTALRQLILKDTTGVLAVPVRVVYQSRCRSPAEPSHGERISNNIRRHPRLIDQPTVSRLNRSSTTARYSQPSTV